MIILTAEEAEQVRGATSPGAALQPRELIDGDFVLPEAVLADLAHAEHHLFLGALPTREVEADEFPQSDE